MRPSAYALVRNEHGQLATARTKRGLFLPGGGVDAGETPEQAATRETSEECGLIILPGRFVGKALEIVHVPRRRACVGKDSFFFEANVIGLSSPIEQDHFLEWVDVDRALEILLDRSHQWAVSQLIEGFAGQ